MYRVCLWNHNGEIIATGDQTLIENWQNDPELFIWLDAVDNEASEESKLLQKTFGLHPLALSDAQRQRHPPKLETFENHWFLLLKELTSIEDDIDFTTTQLAMFTDKRYIVTRRSGGSPAVTELEKGLSGILSSSGDHPANLTLWLAKYVADAYIRMLLSIEDHLEELEVEMFEHPHDRILAELVGYQTYLRKMIRILSYHKQIFYDYEVKELPEVEPALAHDWNNAYEHSERGHSLASLYYENASDLVDGYISVASHRLNQIMKVLTVITVIFVPLSFIAGIYGMNFENMPELKSKSGYFILLGTMGFIATSLLFVLKRKPY